MTRFAAIDDAGMTTAEPRTVRQFFFRAVTPDSLLGDRPARAFVFVPCYDAIDSFSD